MDYMAPRINYQSLLVGQETESRSASYQLREFVLMLAIENVAPSISKLPLMYRCNGFARWKKILLF